LDKQIAEQAAVVVDVVQLALMQLMVFQVQVVQVALIQLQDQVLF
jgi:hypothetical protein